MRTFRADMHIHTVLSPCGNLEMSPGNIIATAKERKLDIIVMTDHNTTLHAALIQKLGDENGIFVLMGAEVTSKEEVHCLAFFEGFEPLNEFQIYLEKYLPFVKNDPVRFGQQVVVDEQENVLKEIESLLTVGLEQTIVQVRAKVSELNGIFIPAHVDRQRYGLLGQMGLMPENLMPDAVEIYGKTLKKAFLDMYPEFAGFSLIHNSDAHAIWDIGLRHTLLSLGHLTFREIKMSLKGENGREVI